MVSRCAGAGLGGHGLLQLVWAQHLPAVSSLVPWQPCEPGSVAILI